jgi:RNA polymerase sigma-70 factor (ECF subfamily)
MRGNIDGIVRAVTKRPRSCVLTSGLPRTRDDQKDRERLADLASGRPEALGDLYDSHASSLFRHALALSRRRPEAEDLVQAVFMKLATTGAPLLGVRKPASYLHRMLHSAWVDAHRRKAAEDAIEGGAADSVASWSPAVEDSIDVSRALDGLPPLQREVIVLHFVEGFSFREVGRLTGVSLFTAAGRYRLAVSRLRKLLT